MLNKKSLQLYAITDSKCLQNISLINAVELALQGGITMLQYREKYLPFDEQLTQSKALLNLCKNYNVPLIINDNIELCKQSNAHGVHLGQNDGDIAYARKVLGNKAIIGVTAKTPEQAKKAYENSANYLGSGAVFGSTTKTDASFIAKDKFNEVCLATSLPVVAIGGINIENLPLLKDYNMAGVAIISGIFAKKDILNATKNLKNIVREVINYEL